VPVLVTDADGRFGIRGFATICFTSALFITSPVSVEVIVAAKPFPNRSDWLVVENTKIGECK